jgi:hypothetical protein
MIIKAILVELAISAIAGLLFMILYANLPWRHSRAGWHLMILSLAMTGEATSLFLLGLGIHLSLWVFAIGYGLIDLAVLHRLLLLWQARRESSESEFSYKGTQVMTTTMDPGWTPPSASMNPAASQAPTTDPPAGG